MLKARKGHIVTIASMASFYAAPGLVDYCCTKVGALYLSEGRIPPSTHAKQKTASLTRTIGLRAELRAHHGAEGRTIQTTSVHPSWHSTGIVKPFEDRLAKFGIKVDPASNVSNAVVEQVLVGRSGQIFMPRTEESKAGMRNYPIWVQDSLLYVNQLFRGFSLNELADRK